jgi:metallopeptidase MepB
VAGPLALSADGQRLGGISAIVAGVPRASGDDPGLLRHDDMVMLYHEFGHVLHEVLGTNRTYRLSMWGVDSTSRRRSQIMEKA